MFDVRNMIIKKGLCSSWSWVYCYHYTLTTMCQAFNITHALIVMWFPFNVVGFFLHVNEITFVPRKRLQLSLSCVQTKTTSKSSLYIYIYLEYNNPIFSSQVNFMLTSVIVTKRLYVVHLNIWTYKKVTRYIYI